MIFGLQSMVQVLLLHGVLGVMTSILEFSAGEKVLKGLHWRAVCEEQSLI
jgi:hypothetical protein